MAINITEDIFTAKQAQKSSSDWQSFKTPITYRDFKRLGKGRYIRESEWSDLDKERKHLLLMDSYARLFDSPVFSHLSAALALGLDVLTVPDKIQVRRTGGSAPDFVQSRRDEATLNADTVLSDDGFLCTSIEDTVLSCVRFLKPYEGLVIAESALYKGLVDYETLFKKLMASPRKGNIAARWVAGIMSPLSESPGETLTRLLLLDLGLEPVQQLQIGPFRVDFALLEYNIIVEFDGAIKYDGRFGLSSEETLARQENREQYLRQQGWIVVRLTWEDVVVHREQALRKLSLTNMPPRNWVSMYDHGLRKMRA